MDDHHLHQTEASSSPLISLIIPVHNGDRTLEACLASAFRSSYPHYEVIVVDDASRDRSTEIAGSYPCRVVRLAENQGAAVAKNRGAAQAKGEILFFTDADVVLPEEALHIVAENLADPNIDGVVGLLSPDLPYPNFASQYKNLWMHLTYARQPRYVGLFYTSAASIRKEVFLAEGGFDERYRGASVTEDMELGQRLLASGRRIVLDKRLQVRHLKHYSLGDLLRTDFTRARAMVKIWLRNKLAHTKRKYFTSVPWGFTASVPFSGLMALGLLLTIWHAGWGLRLVAGSYALILMLNGGFLAALRRLRGWRFFLQSCLFLPLDLFVSGLGVVSAFADATRKRLY